MESDLSIEASAIQLYDHNLPSNLFAELLNDVGGLDHYELSKILPP